MTGKQHATSGDMPSVVRLKSSLRLKSSRCTACLHLAPQVLVQVPLGLLHGGVQVSATVRDFQDPQVVLHGGRPAAAGAAGRLRGTGDKILGI